MLCVDNFYVEVNTCVMLWPTPYWSCKVQKQVMGGWIGWDRDMILKLLFYGLKDTWCCFECSDICTEKAKKGGSKYRVWLAWYCLHVWRLTKFHSSLWHFATLLHVSPLSPPFPVWLYELSCLNKDKKWSLKQKVLEKVVKILYGNACRTA